EVALGMNSTALIAAQRPVKHRKIIENRHHGAQIHSGIFRIRRYVPMERTICLCLVAENENRKKFLITLKNYTT
ncbi:MAG: hypothetical protein KGM99_15170, partial [Burkholderiales bacterium]|nr:hypothetical protein [Burkholderiales bacterium]